MERRLHASCSSEPLCNGHNAEVQTGLAWLCWYSAVCLCGARPCFHCLWLGISLHQEHRGAAPGSACSVPQGISARSCPLALPCSQHAAAAPGSCTTQHQSCSAPCSDRQTAAGEPSQASARLSTFAQQRTREVMHSLQNSEWARRAKRHNIHGQPVGSEVCLSGYFSARTRKPSTTSSQPTRLIHV